MDGILFLHLFELGDSLLGLTRAKKCQRVIQTVTGRIRCKVKCLTEFLHCLLFVGRILENALPRFRVCASFSTSTLEESAAASNSNPRPRGAKDANQPRPISCRFILF